MAQPIIAVRIEAGLGNQMFQYATARRLAHRCGGELVLLLGDRFGPGAERTYGLDQFMTTGRRADDEDAARGYRRVSRMRMRIGGFLPWFAVQAEQLPVLAEASVWDLKPKSEAGELGDNDQLLFRPDMLAWSRSAELRGYWQDERYFADVADMIRREFTLQRRLDARNLETLELIRSRPSAFIHVRRGDYLTPHFRHMFGVCDSDYYRRALEVVRGRHGDGLPIFVFSDDPEWARDNAIGGPNCVVVDWNGAAPECDIALMSACRHGVIANSSFSWWGAWLGEQPDSTVIAPRVWFEAVPEFRDIVPQRWLRL